MKIIAVVIWYNPDIRMVKNIKSYSMYVYKTLIIDNSFEDNSSYVENMGNIEYFPLNKNIGIAAAFNLGYARAEELGADWVLTMDQDSSFSESHVKEYLDPCATHFKHYNVAVYGPNFEEPVKSDLIDCNSVISSGSLVSLAAHKIISGYNEDLFIDQVDHEYCCRLKKLGYRILCVGYISMEHTIGFPLTKKRFGRNFISYNHDAVRKYYMTRNLLYMRRHYGEFGNKHLKIIFMDIINIIFIEEDKYNKLKSILKGCSDYFRGRMGSID